MLIPIIIYICCASLQNIIYYGFSQMWPGLLTHYGKVIAPDLLGFGYSDKPVSIISICNYCNINRISFIITITLF